MRAPLILVGTLALVGAARGEAPGPPPPPSFLRDVMPLFDRWCVRCHGHREQQSGLRLDSYEAVMAGGDTGPSVIAGDAAGSLLVAKIEGRDRPAMPPRRHLPAAAVARIRAWIDSGARGGASPPANPPTSEASRRSGAAPPVNERAR